jgi:DNA-binding LacI/PurR family transcriptional regulator
MRTRRYFNVGYFVATVPGEMTGVDFPEFRSGACDAAASHDYHLSLIRLPAVFSPQINPIPKAFREAHLDALVVNSMGGVSPEIQQAITRSGFPVVYLNEKRPVNAVYFDDEKAGRELTAYLIGQGYRRIAFVSEPLEQLRHYSGTDRREGYAAVMCEQGLEPEFFTLEPRGSRLAAAAWLRSPQRPEAVVCNRDRDALLLQTCAAEAGWRIGEHLAVASASNERLLDDYFRVPLTTMVQPRYECAAAAVRMAISMVGEPAGSERPAVVLKAGLRVGGSTPRREELR